MLLLLGLVLFFYCFYGLYLPKYHTRLTDVLFTSGIAVSLVLLMLWLFDALLVKGG